MLLNFIFLLKREKKEIKKGKKKITKRVFPAIDPNQR
jgi:hypothetical protein